MGKFFNEIVAPQLAQTDYGQGIESMVNNINANFQKVFTLPFLKGDDGDRLTTRFCPFWEKPEGAEDYILTEEGYKIFKAIFIDDKIKNGVEFYKTKPGCKFGDLMDDLKAAGLFSDSENSGKTQFEEAYGPKGNPKILLYYQIDTESNNETLLGAAQLYYFFDTRIQGLSDFIGVNNTETVEGFVDYTCILSTKYVNGNEECSYKYEKQSGWPTLYFDSQSKQFCWQINGQKTGVNAQGVNGRDGRGSKIWLCVVEPEKTVTSANSVLKEDAYLTGDYCKFKITKLWVPKVNGWLNINDEKDYKTALNALGDSGLPSSGDIFIAYLNNDVELINMPVYAAGLDKDKNPIYTQVTEDGNPKVVTFNRPPVSLYGTLFYNSQSSDPYDNKYFIFSNISQNLYRSTDNLILIDMLNNIGDLVVNTQGEDGVQSPVRSPKGLFLPLLKSGNKTHDHVHVMYNDPADGSLNLEVDTYNNVARLVEGDKLEKSEGGVKNLNIIYNTNLNGDLNVTGSTTLIGKKNPGAEKNLVNNLSNFPLVIDTQNEDNKLIIGPQDLYAIDKSGNPITFCINQKPEAEVIIGNNILTVKDKEVYISQEAHKSPGTKGRYGTSFEGDIVLYASYASDNQAFNIPWLAVKTSSKYDGNYDATHFQFVPGVGDDPFVIKRGLRVEGDILPHGDGITNLGSNSEGNVHKWGNVYTCGLDVVGSANELKVPQSNNELIVISRAVNKLKSAIQFNNGSINIYAQKEQNDDIVKTNVGIHYDKGVTVAGTTTITGVTTIQSASKNGKKIVVDATGVGINATPVSSYSLKVGGALNVTGETILDDELWADGGATITGVTTIRTSTNNTGTKIVVNPWGVGINTAPSSSTYALNVNGSLYATDGYKITTGSNWGNVNRYIPFCGYSNSTSSDLIKYYKDGFTFNPNTDTLTVANIDVEDASISNIVSNGLSELTQLYVNTNEYTVDDFDPGNYSDVSLVVTGDSYQGNILPNTNNQYTLGSENRKWSKVWSLIFDGDLNGGIYLNNDNTTNEEHSIVFATRTNNFLPHSLYTDYSNFKYNPSSSTLTVKNLKVIGATITDSLTVNDDLILYGKRDGDYYPSKLHNGSGIKIKSTSNIADKKNLWILGAAQIYDSTHDINQIGYLCIDTSDDGETYGDYTAMRLVWLKPKNNNLS